MRVLIACEFSGRVRDAFIARGHYALSCDLIETEAPGPHYMGDVFDLIDTEHWDLMIAHPPCTHLAVSGARYFHMKKIRQRRALAFVQDLLGSPIHMVALENPVSVISTRIRKPDQYIQPWMFGHGETKKTGLWLKNLPLLEPTDIVEGREGRVWRMTPGPNRSKDRGRTYQGIADAMADQWGSLECP
jgi:hypothetical protein